jgi:hypothetical protein
MRALTAGENETLRVSKRLKCDTDLARHTPANTQDLVYPAQPV